MCGLSKVVYGDCVGGGVLTGCGWVLIGVYVFNPNSWRSLTDSYSKKLEIEILRKRTCIFHGLEKNNAGKG